MIRVACLLSVVIATSSPVVGATLSEKQMYHAEAKHDRSRHSDMEFHPKTVMTVSETCEVSKPVVLTGKVIYADSEEPLLPESPELEAREVRKSQASALPVQRDLKNGEVNDAVSPNAQDIARRSWHDFLKTLSAIFSTTKSFRGAQTPVAGLSRDQAKQLADAIVSYVVTVEQPESTTLLLVPGSHSDGGFRVQLSDSLRKSGFGLVESKRQAPGAEILRYHLSQQDDGLYLQVRYKQLEASRFYRLNKFDSLFVGGPLCVREVD